MDVTGYLNLIPDINYQKPKYMAFVQALIEQSVDLTALLYSFDMAFDINNASGKQLDTIGELLNVDRLLKFMPTSGSRYMNDTEYRLVLLLKIAQNAWDGTNESAREIYKSVFSGYLYIQYVDNMDGSVDIIVSGTPSSTSREAEILNSTGELLVPVGIKYTVSYIGGENEERIIIATNAYGIAVENTSETSGGADWRALSRYRWSELASYTWGTLPEN